MRQRMCRGATILLALIAFTSPAQCRDRKVFIGGIMDAKADPENYIEWRFGVEQWEQGRRTSHRLQVWWLRCYGKTWTGKSDQTACTLQRTVLDRWMHPEKDTFLTVKEHTTEDGSLLVKRLSWEKGELDFDIVYSDDSTTEAIVRFQVDRRSRSIFLTKFTAIGISRGLLSDSLGAVEYRIPEYTYTVQIPVELPGYKSDTDKLLDELESSLSADDRSVWDSMGREGVLFDFLHKSWLQKALPSADWISREHRQPTPSELEQVRSAVLKGVAQRLSQTTMSAGGQQRCVAVVAELLKEF